ncbi:MAG TPA: hypothetical protein VHQ47_02710 [Phycisphaerae bacterium]|nr:hypothetical protein [Phycisphaerae bacterium]
MTRLIRKVYRSLPVIRELQHAHSQRNELREKLSKLIILQQELFYARCIDQQKYMCPLRLTRHEHQVYSQHGEDGIIAEVLRRVGTSRKVFLEIGVGDGLENNSAFLLAQGWTGCWLEGSNACCDKIRRGFKRQMASGSLTLKQSFITRENINSLVEGWEAVDVLSIDIDLNTYYIWEAIRHIGARLIVVEYNGTVPPSVDWKARYDANGWWDGSNYMGASLKAYELLGIKLGYSLVGCDISGTNAFFVRNDLVEGRFHGPFTAEEHFEPARYWLDRRNGHPIGYGDFLHA